MRCGLRNFAAVLPPVGGLGLGLALVKNLGAMHHGAVAVESEGAGHGCRFTHRFPALDTESTARAAATAPPGIGAFRSRLILVIDDSQDAAETQAELVDLGGHEVLVAYDGALGLLATEGFAPEVVLLDLGLPGIDGYEVARRLGDRPGREQMRLIAVTGYGQEADRRLIREAGFDDHRTKPLDPDVLQIRLSEADLD